MSLTVNAARKIKRSDIPEEEILAACIAFHSHQTQQTPDESLAHKYPPKVILARMEQMCAKGILESGVSTRTAWPMGWKG